MAVLFGITSVAAAHVKWFVEADSIAPNKAFTFLFSDLAVQIWLVILVAALIVAYLLNRMMIPPPQIVVNKGEQYKSKIIYLFQLIVGISLVLTSYSGSILAPHLKDPTVFAVSLRLLEGVVGVLLIANFYVFIAAILLFCLFIASTAVFGFLMSVEYFNLLGIAVFLLILKAPKNYRLTEHQIWALPLLRLHTGIALCVLAFSEKLLRPELAMAFLDKHQVNFMQNLGVGEFSNHLFVLSAGCSELLFGLIFLLGFITRINTLSLAFFLIASNVYFFVVGKPAEGILEIIGHANLIAIAIILIIYGAGEKIRVSIAPIVGHRAGARIGT